MLKGILQKSLVVVATCLLGWQMACHGNEVKRPPNVIYILVDDMGSADPSWRGGEVKTPHLDQLALGGARLEAYYVQPVCSPTRSSLMTGRYPFRYGFQVGVVRPWAHYGLPLEERLLPESLKKLGYETAISGKWHLGHLSKEYLPTSRGFDHQYGHYNGALDYNTHQREGGHDWHKNDQPNYDEGYSTHLIGKEAVARIKERDQKKPLFLYVAFNAPHTPLQVPDAYIQPYAHLPKNRQLYAGMVACIDEQVGAMVKALKEENLFEDTLIIFSSDNGGERPGRVSSNLPYREGKFSTYEGGVRVCAFAHWKGVISSGSKVEDPIHVVDWYPTLIELAGGKVDQPLSVDGKNVWSVVQGKSKAEKRTLVLNLAPHGGAIRVGDHKLVVKREKNQKPQYELYHLLEDPEERENLAEKNAAKVQELREVYEQLEAQGVAPQNEGSRNNFKPMKVWGHPEMGYLEAAKN